MSKFDLHAVNCCLIQVSNINAVPTISRDSSFLRRISFEDCSLIPSPLST